MTAASPALLTVVLSIPKQVTDKVNKLEKDAVNHDNNAGQRDDHYNQLMAQYAVSGKNRTTTTPSKTSRKRRTRQKGGRLRQQEATCWARTTVPLPTTTHAATTASTAGSWRARSRWENKTHVHYDETLRTAGPVNHYEIVNWFEDNLSHDATGGAETFWWPAP